MSPLTGLNKVCFMIPGAYAPGYPSSGPMGLIGHMSLDALLVPVKSIALLHLKLDTTLVYYTFSGCMFLANILFIYFHLKSNHPVYQMLSSFIEKKGRREQLPSEMKLYLRR